MQKLNHGQAMETRKSPERMQKRKNDLFGQKSLSTSGIMTLWSEILEMASQNDPHLQSISLLTRGH